MSPLLSYSFADAERGTKDGYGANISVGRRMASGLNLELTGFFGQMDSDVASSDDTASLYGFGIGAMLFPLVEYPEAYFIAALHQGFTEKHPGTTTVDFKSTVFDSGVGYLVPLSLEGIGLAAGSSLRLEARYRMDSHHREGAGDPGNEDEFYDGVVNIGLLIPLGNLPEPPAEPEEEPTQVVPAESGDSDNDGVPDDVDQCPDTPAGAIVDENGCELDEDGDGVVDRLDKCPGTPPGTPVDENGCPIQQAAGDTDGDGVADDVDKCPNTPAGTPVNATGCPEDTGCREPAPGEPITLEGCASGDAIVLRGVNFEFNSARLTANAKVILDQVADALIAAANIVVEIGGHTDAVGSDAYNQKLSEKRAISVYDYLVSRGVDNKRLTFKGYGEAQAIATNDTDEGREINRRVELKVIGE